MSVKKNVFYTTALQLPIVSLNILAGIFMTRLLGPEGKGVFALFRAGLDLFILLLGLSMQTGIIYFLASGRIAKNKLLGISFCIVIAGLVMNGVVLLVANKTGTLHYFFASGYTSKFYYLWFSAMLGMQMFNTVVHAMLQGETKFRIINGMQLLNGILYLATFCTLFYTWEKEEYLNIRLYFLLVLAISGALSAAWSVLLIKKVKTKPSFNIDFQQELKPFLSFNLVAYAANLTLFFNYRLDLWIVEYYKDLSKVGMYSLAVNTANFLLIITTPIAGVLYSYFSKGDSKENRYALAFYSRVNFTLIGALCIIGFFSADIIPFVYGNEFAESTTPFRYLLPGFLFLCATKIFISYNGANNKPQYNLLAALVALSTTVALDFLLIPFYGINGAAIASSLAYFVLFLVLYFYCFKKFNLPKANYFIANWSDIKELLAILKHK